MKFKAYHLIREDQKVFGKVIRFMRFGGLSPVRQVGFKRWKNVGNQHSPNSSGRISDPSNKNDPPTFHTPPARKGIYAFVWPFYDLFLVPREKYQIKKDKNGKPIYFGDEGDEDRFPDLELPHPKLFDWNGPLWHHLGEWVNPKDIIATRGSWTKTSFPVFIDALRKDAHANTSTDFSRQWNPNGPYRPNWQFSKANPFRHTSKDHLEVFIEDLH